MTEPEYISNDFEVQLSSEYYCVGGYPVLARSTQKCGSCGSLILLESWTLCSTGTPVITKFEPSCDQLLCPLPATAARNRCLRSRLARGEGLSRGEGGTENWFCAEETHAAAAAAVAAVATTAAEAAEAAGAAAIVAVADRVLVMRWRARS